MSDPHPLPDLYAGWLDAWSSGPPPTERRATCGDCPMCAVPGQAPPATAYPFRPDLKCCASMPILPSFQVGGALRDGVGAASIRARIKARAAVGPLGLGRPAAWRLVAEHAVNIQGRSRSLRCPHFVDADGTCGVHAHRNHACATWFCKHERGAVGQAWWLALGDLLRTIEQELSRWCALELGLDPALLARQLGRPGPSPVEDIDADAVDGVVSDDVWARRWGPWAGREESFYLACADRVAALDPDEVLRLGGATAAVQVAALRSAGQLLADDHVPERLRVGAMQFLAIGAQGALVATYSALDPLTLPTLLTSVLHYFDGRPTAQAMEAIAEDRGLKLDPTLVRQLLDFAVLR